MIFSIKKASVLAALLLLTSNLNVHHVTQAQAVAPPHPDPKTHTNEDGTLTPPIYLRLMSGPDGGYTSFKETRDGYTVEFDNKRSSLVYVDVDESNGELVKTNITVRQYDDSHKSMVNPNAMHRWKQLNQVKPEYKAAAESRRLKVEEIRKERALATSTTGTMKNLVVLFKFSDHANIGVPTKAQVETFYNGATNSIKDVFLKSSFNKLTIESTVHDWVTLNATYTEAYCTANEQGMGTSKLIECMKNALDKLKDAGFDFTAFDTNPQDGTMDGIAFLHSGYDASVTQLNYNVWPHMWLFSFVPGAGGEWSSPQNVKVDLYYINSAHDTQAAYQSVYKIATIGTAAHETGHFLGLPDLYASDGKGNGIGNYGIMGNSWGWDGTANYPPIMSAWGKIKMEWIETPVVIDNTKALGSYEYVLRKSCDFPDVIKITKGFPSGEYLLLENRQKCGYDKDLQGPGLAVWHMDEHVVNTVYVNAGIDFMKHQNNGDSPGYRGQNDWPKSGTHYFQALLQADGEYHLEKDTTNIGKGDAHDLFKDGDSIGPYGVILQGTTHKLYPNTNAYQSGTILDSGVTIHANTTNTDGAMTITIQLADPKLLENLSSSAEAVKSGAKRKKVPKNLLPLTVTEVRDVIGKVFDLVDANDPENRKGKFLDE